MAEGKGEIGVGTALIQIVNGAKRHWRFGSQQNENELMHPPMTTNQACLTIGNEGTLIVENKGTLIFNYQACLICRRYQNQGALICKTCMSEMTPKSFPCTTCMLSCTFGFWGLGRKVNAGADGQMRKRHGDF